MATRKALFCLLFCLIFAQVSNAGIEDDSLKGEDLIFQRKYDEAVKVFRNIEELYPDSPTGAFGQMAAYQMHMFENIDFRFASEFEAAEKKFEQLSYKQLKNNPSSWDLFIMGAGYGMRGFYYAREGHWFRALGSAVRATQILKRLAYEDPDFKDANLGLGMYNFWRSYFTKSIKFLPFFGDKRKEGISQVEEVVTDGKYAKRLAETNLAFIFSAEKRYPESRTIVNKYLKMYPENIIIRQLSGKLYALNREYDKAIGEYSKILKEDPSATKSLFFMGVISLGMPDGRFIAKKYFEDFLATNPEKQWKKMALKQVSLLE